MDQGADFTTTINLDNVDGTNFDLTGYTENLNWQKLMRVLQKQL